MNEATISLLRCPICHGALTLKEKSLVCERRHCYDIARQGHVNFVPNQKDSFYTKELFESRAAVFAAGVFEPVIAALTEAIETYVQGEKVVFAPRGGVVISAESAVEFRTLKVTANKGKKVLLEQNFAEALADGIIAMEKGARKGYYINQFF